MTNFEIYRLLDLPEKLQEMRVYRVTEDGHREFGFGWANKLTKYFIDEPANSVNYPACHYIGSYRHDGILTVKRNGDFAFKPI